MSAKIIGTVTTYTGTEHPYLAGCKVRIVAMLRGAAAPDADPDQVEVIRDDAGLGNPVRTEQGFGDSGTTAGVTAEDRVEVQPWLEAEGRFSFVTSDARAVDLDCFRHLVSTEGDR